ncbi:MAG: hypothetical protein ACKVQB_08080, partial [Bacteroidia bacterium]
DLTYRKSDVWAKGNSTGAEYTRDYRYRVNSVNFGYGYKLGSNKESIKGKYLGADFSMIIIKNATRVYKTGATIPEYQLINWDLDLGFSPFVQLVGSRFTAKFYYQFMLIGANYWDLNVAINPNTWYNDDYESNKGKTSSLGMSLRYNLFKNKK